MGFLALHKFYWCLCCVTVYRPGSFVTGLCARAIQQYFLLILYLSCMHLRSKQESTFFCYLEYLIAMGTPAMILFCKLSSSTGSVEIPKNVHSLYLIQWTHITNGSLQHILFHFLQLNDNVQFIIKQKQSFNNGYCYVAKQWNETIFPKRNYWNSMHMHEKIITHFYQI